MPSLLDTADELTAVAGKLGAAAGDIHLGQDASETMVKRAALGDYKVVYFPMPSISAGRRPAAPVRSPHMAADPRLGRAEALRQAMSCLPGH